MAAWAAVDRFVKYRHAHPRSSCVKGGRQSGGTGTYNQNIRHFPVSFSDILCISVSMRTEEEIHTQKSGMSLFPSPHILAKRR